MTTFRFPPFVAKQHTLVTSSDLQNEWQPPHILLFLHFERFFFQALIIANKHALTKKDGQEIFEPLGKKSSLLPGTSRSWTPQSPARN